MEEKFNGLSKTMRLVLVIVSWLLTALGFGGCLLLRELQSIFIVEILLTCFGIFCAVIAICLTILLAATSHSNDEKQV